VASFELVDLPLIECMARTRKPLIMSTGLATADEIGEAVDAARGAGCTELALLHCTSSYPTPPDEANLAVLGRLAECFDAVVGLSDHTLGSAVAVSAVALGAAIVEKHVALRRADGGPDAGFSLEPDEFADMAEACAIAWRAIGSPEIGRTPSEAENLIFRRSLYAVQNIKAGGTFSAENLRSIRPGHGLAPKHLPALLGRCAARDLARGTAITWDDVAGGR
jgi:N-acetylneuraminate synthase